MIQKSIIEVNGRPVVRLKFTVPNSTEAETIHLVGNFNGWNHRSHPFQRDGKRGWTLTVNLELGQAYQFRYLRDNEEWMYDSQADAYVYNPSGNHNFVVITDPNFKRYDGKGN